MEKINLKKSLGQNFINDIFIIDNIIDVSEVDKDTLVIEIGPGAGALSKNLVKKSGFLLLYEIDGRLEEILNNKLKGYVNYKLFIKDFLSVSLKDDISEYKKYKKVVVVANIPYYITTPIINKLIDEIYPDRIVIMIQEEVANRITALPGGKEYGFMSVIVQSKYKAYKEFVVDKQYFNPIPKVDSAVIRLDKREDLSISDYDFFVKFVEDAFRFKRKNIKNNLNNYDLDRIDNILNKYNLSVTNRSEEVPIECFIDIVNNLKEHE